MCLGSEIVHGGFKASNHHCSLPLTNQLSFRPMCHSGHWLFLYCHWPHSLTAWHCWQAISEQIWFYHLEWTGVALFSSKNWDILVSGMPFRLTSFTSLVSKIFRWNQCKLYQRNAQQSGHSARCSSQQVDHWYQALPIQTSTCSRIPTHGPRWSVMSCCLSKWSNQGRWHRWLAWQNYELFHCPDELPALLGQ